MNMEYRGGSREQELTSQVVGEVNDCLAHQSSNLTEIDCWETSI